VYETLFTRENPNEVAEGGDFTDNLNPKSLEVIPDAKLEPSLRDAPAGTRVQFERLGYFCVDKDSSSEKLVFNRTVGLKDTWAKIEQKGK
jgi:glutaminyl-tRNA synthetase